MAAVKTRNTATLMTEGSIVKSLLLFALPLIFGNLLQQMYNTADSIIVGNFVGSNALAAVGSSGSPIYLLIGFSQGLAVGAGVVVSQYLGAGDHKETREAVHTALAIAVVMGLLLTVGGVACGRAISAARPGARRETLETYTNRLKQLEDITNSFEGVDKSFAIQAGREIRVMVIPEKVTDADMVLMARDISKQIEAELEYPGQIKVNVVRESRAIDYAK